MREKFSLKQGARRKPTLLNLPPTLQSGGEKVGWVRFRNSRRFSTYSLFLFGAFLILGLGIFKVNSNLAFAQSCKPVDVMLVIDKSGSMANTIGSETKTKMEAAKEASNDFIDFLDFGKVPPDHIGIVSFSDDAVLNQQLNNDKILAKNAVDTLSPGGGTWTNKGINKAWVEFDARGRGDSPHAMIILTDGKPDAVVLAQNEATIAKNKGIKMIVIGYDIGSTADPAGTRDVLKSLASTISDYYEAPMTTDLQNIYNQVAAQMCDDKPPVITGPSRLPSGTVFPGDEIKITSNATDNQVGDWGLEIHRINWTSNNWATTNSCDSGLTPGVKTNSFICTIGPFIADTEIKYKNYAKDLALFETTSPTYSFKVATVTISVAPDALGRLRLEQLNTITAQISDPQGKADLNKYYIEIESPSGGAIKVSKTEMTCVGTGSLYTCAYSFTPTVAQGWGINANIKIYPWDNVLGFHNVGASREVDVLFDTTPPTVTISRSPSDPVLNTDTITLTSVAGDVSGLQNQKIFYWRNGSQNTYNCNDVAPQDGECDGDATKDIGNISINIGPYSAATYMEYQAEATDNWNNTSTTAKLSFTVLSAECYNLGPPRTQRPNLTVCTGGKCCAGICDTSFTCGMDDECRQEICSGTSWTCQAANLEANCSSGTSGDGCYDDYCWRDFGGGYGCQIKDYFCNSSGRCVFSASHQNCDQCEGGGSSKIKNYRCGGGVCDYQIPKIDCEEDDNWDGDTIACNCNCNGYDVVESAANGNCTDDKDNDCDDSEDCEEAACDNVAPTTAISAYDNTSTLISTGGDVVDTKTNKVSLTVTSTEIAPCLPSPNILSRVKVFYNVNGGPWISIFDCIYTSPQNGECDSDPSKNIASFSVEIPVAGFSAGTRVGYRSEATDTAPVPNTGYDESFFNVISVECNGQPNLTVCSGGKCCSQVCSSFNCSLHNECREEICSGISWTCQAKNEGSSCLSGTWLKRKPITINNANSSKLENYQVKLEIPYDSDMQSDFDDLRFTDSNDAPLSYWLESKNDGVSAVVWVKVPSLAGSSSGTVYMRYGNPSASSGSNGVGTFEFFDGFDAFNSTKWAATGAYSISSGNLAITTGAVYSKSTAASQPGFISEAKVKWNNFASYSGLEIANAQSTSGSNAGSNKLVYLMTNSGSANVAAWAANGTAASYNIVSGGTQFTASAGTTYIIGYAVNSSSVIFYRNRAITNSYTGSWSSPFYLWLGYFTGSSSGTTNISDLVVDWVLVRKYALSEPTFEIQSEESASFNEEPGCFSYGSGCEQTLSSTCQAGLCLISLQNQYLDYCDGINLMDYGCGIFTKRAPIAINNTSNPSTLQNYQVKIEIPYDSDMQADFDDLRFQDEDENSLSYWIENKTNGVSATLWIKIPLIPANSTKTVYMYYGNGGASSASDGEATFDFFDNFEKGIIDSGKWTSSGVEVSGGRLRLYESSDYIYTTRTDWSRPFIVEYTFNTSKTSKRNNHGVKDITTSVYYTGYEHGTQLQTSGRLYQITNNVFGTQYGTYSANQTYKVKKIIKSSGADYYIDGVLKYSTATGNDAVRAWAASQWDGNANVYYDDIKVRKYTLPEPTTDLGGKEDATASFCGLISSNSNPSCDTQAPTPAVEARDNTNSLITDGAEVLPSLTNKVTLNSSAFDNYALQSHQLQYRKYSGGVWGTWYSCEDLDNDGNFDFPNECTSCVDLDSDGIYDLGECADNLEIVSISLGFISVKIGPFNNNDAIEYRTIAADTAQPVPYSTTVQKSFISKIPNNIPTVTPISPPIVYPNGSDYWKGENQEADCWRSLQTVVSWTYNDIDGNCQRAYQVEVYSDPGLTTLVKDSCNENNTGTCVPCSDTGRNCEPCGTSCSSCSTSSAYRIQFPTIDWNKTYWWRVLVFDGEDWSSWQTGDSFTTPLHPYPTVDFTYNPANPDVAEQVIFTQNSECYTTAAPSTPVDCGTGSTQIKHIGWDFYRVTNTQPNPPSALGESLNVNIDNSDGIDPDLDYNYTYYSNIVYRVYLEVKDQDDYICSFIKNVSVGGMRYPWWREILPK